MAAGRSDGFILYKLSKSTSSSSLYLSLVFFSVFTNLVFRLAVFMIVILQTHHTTVSWLAVWGSVIYRQRLDKMFTIKGAIEGVKSATQRTSTARK